MLEIAIEKGYTPGAIGRVAELHGTYYAEHWGFGCYFEGKVATAMAEFFVRYDEERDGFWTVSVDGRVEGSIAIDGIYAKNEGAHLRWFIMSDILRGQGMGNRLMDTVIDFCREKGYEKVYLWTFDGLDAARHLYEKAGFELVEQFTGTQWGTAVEEQRFELMLR
jgi:N-acetylglutamate synthase-like GNAT family acetyltransferase